MTNILPMYVWTTALLWIIVSLIIAFLGDQRQIGFVRAFIASFFLSPLLGMFITLSTERKDVARWRRRLTRRSIVSSKFIHNNKDIPHATLHDEMIINTEKLLQRTYELQQCVEELQCQIQELQEKPVQTEKRNGTAES